MIDNKVSIAYRIYPKVSKIPAIFEDDKYKLSKLCLESFKKSLSNIDYKIWVLLDNCPDEYKDLFTSLFPSERLVMMELPGVGNPVTFQKQIDLLLEQDHSENIYFAEDDYFYLPDTFQEMIEVMQLIEDVDFVSPYDHLDYYTLELHNYKSIIHITEKRHWRVSASTCMTFLTTKKIMRQTKKVFLSYTRRNYDSSIWLSLTKQRIFNPFFFFPNLFNDISIFKIFVKAWLYTPINNILGKKHKLLTPVPSIATHIERTGLAPIIDWNKEFCK